MGLTEILVILLGVLAFIGSFVIPEKLTEKNSKEIKIPEEKIKEFVTNLGLTPEICKSGYVYDKVEMLIEPAHILRARLNGQEYAVGFDGICHSYFALNGEKKTKKLRLW